MTTKVIVGQCAYCGRKWHVKVNYKDFLKWEEQNHSNTKEIFPYLTANELYCLNDGIFCSSMCHKKDFEWGC